MSNSKATAPTAVFGLNLLRGEAKGKKGNVILSPLSVSTALGMTANGARGTTLASMRNALGLPDGGADNAQNSASYKALLAALKGKDLGVKLSIANAIYAAERIEFDPAFLTRAMSDFGADVKTADFSDPETLEAINRWVKTNTNEKITKILNEIRPDEVMFLLNALYFKGEWNTKFDKKLTKDATFHAADGDKQHPTMFRNGDMRYAKTGDYQVVALPFGSAKRVHLYVVLPAAGKTPEQVLAGLDASKLFAVKYESEGSLWLPRFKLEYEAELNETLKSLGMEGAFVGGADFSGMRKENDLFISKVIHKCVCSFDEDGGELAAATSVGMALECLRMPWEMKVDRPFVAVLADEQTEAVIGAGVVANP